MEFVPNFRSAVAALFVIAVGACFQRNAAETDSNQSVRADEVSAIDLKKKQEDNIVKFIKKFDQTPPAIKSKNLKIKISIVNDRGVFLAYLNGSHWCGSSSCTLVFFEKSKSGYRSIGLVSGVQLPVVKYNRYTNGLPTIGSLSPGMGGRPSETIKIQFDGDIYKKMETRKNETQENFLATELINESSGYIRIY